MNLAYVRGKTVPVSDPGQLLGQLHETLQPTMSIPILSLPQSAAGLRPPEFAWRLFTRGWRSPGWLLLGVMLPVFAVCVATIFWLEEGRKNPDRAIVLKDQVPAHYAPAESAKVITNSPSAKKSMSFPSAANGFTPNSPAAPGPGCRPTRRNALFRPVFFLKDR